ncbi:MAG: hypothetical protein ABL899_03440 [Nitrospira sp.]
MTPTQIVVTNVINGRFIGIVGIFTSIENVIEGIRAYEDKHLGGKDPRRTPPYVLIQTYYSEYGERGDMHYIEGEMGTFVLTMDVVTNHPVGIALPNPNVAG